MHDAHTVVFFPELHFIILMYNLPYTTIIKNHYIDHLPVIIYALGTYLHVKLGSSPYQFVIRK